MFHDPARFAFTAALIANWRSIRDEYLGVRGAMTDWVERELYDQGWQVFGVYDFPHGAPLPQNVAACPVTARLVAELFPRHGAAGFSLLRPGTRIRPHEGYAGPYLRCHLGLIVPPGECRLRVLDQTRSWREGDVLVFDDRVTHEAWNLTGADRVVLLVDFVP